MVSYIAQKTTTKYCGHKCNSAAYKQIKREEKVNAEFKNQQSKIVSSLQTVNNALLPTPQAGNHINLREKEFLSILEVATLWVQADGLYKQIKCFKHLMERANGFYSFCIKALPLRVNNPNLLSS